MNEEMVVGIMTDTIKLILMIITPLFIGVIVVGVSINILQTITQVKDQTLTFAPKILTAFLILLFMIPWYINLLNDFFVRLMDIIEMGVI